MGINFNLNNKTALITGASSGMGEHFARTLNAAGARVILTGRSIEKLECLSRRMDNSIAIKMDVSDKKSVMACFAELNKAGEKIDICVNNSGIASFTSIFDDDNDGDFESIIQTNLMGVWYVTKQAAHHMKHNGIQGSIINIASVNGASKSREWLSAYAASKAAVIHLTKSLVGELSPYKIRINCISPGLVETPLTMPILDTDEKRKKIACTIPLGFVAKPHDLDGCLLLLASDAYSSYISGACITVDGGVSWGGS